MTTRNVQPATTDQAGTVQGYLNTAGVDQLHFRPGIHRLNKTLFVTQPTKILAHNATLDLQMANWGMLVNAPLKIEGAHLIGRTDVPLTLATGNGGSIEFVGCTVEVPTTSQNIQTIGATNSAFRSPTGWNNAIIDRCSFHADCYIGGATKLTSSSFHNARLLSHYQVGGLKGATVKDVHWHGNAGLRNEHESLMFEDCDVLDSVFENLWFHGCIGPVIQYWGWSGGSMKNCTFRNVISDGPSYAGITLVALKGEASGNLFENVIIARATWPVIVGKGCGQNTFRNMYVTNPEPWIHHAGFWGLSHDWTAMWRDGVQAFPWEPKDMTDPANMTVLSDYGTETKWEHVRISGANGARVSNLPLTDPRFVDVLQKD